MKSNIGYCPQCDMRVEFRPWPDNGGESIVVGCSRCDNVLVYESRDAFIESERQKLEEYKACDHVAAEHQEIMRCRYCALPQSEWMYPQKVIDTRALEGEDRRLAEEAKGRS